MGTRIEAATALVSHGLRRPTARRFADTAARTCLARAGRAPGDVDLLINSGIYRDDCLGEPALAALIQEDIGANLGHPTRGKHGTFSFDLANGTCSVISAIQVMAGFQRSGAMRLGLIVASDVDPNRKGSRSLPFRPAGGAMLLGWDDDIAGFTDFHIETFPEYEDRFQSHMGWKAARGPRVPMRATGRSQLRFDEKPGYRARCVDCAEDATRHFLNRLGMSMDEIDLVVPAPSSPDFLDSLKVRLGVPGDRIAYVGEDLAGSYTTGPIAAMEVALKSGRLAEADNTLMVAAGAGITVALALYRRTPPPATTGL